MDPKQPCSIPWFRRYMRLNGSGMVPTITPNEFMPSNEAVAELFGPKCSVGFTFDNHLNEEYDVYVRELFQRVLQLKWPINSILPFDFARGLAAEALEVEVNWAEFAFKQTHPYVSNYPLSRLLPEYESLREPLGTMKKVLPFPNFKVEHA